MRFLKVIVTLDEFYLSELDLSIISLLAFLVSRFELVCCCLRLPPCIIQKQNLKMSVLKQKLDRAAELFQTHEFKQALGAYEECIAFCYRTREAQPLIFNIMTTKAALQNIIGESDRAMATLNQVLRADPNHYLALTRRSQVYKKKGKFNRALKDLEIVSSFCPDNLQLTAMKIEIETLKSKNKNCNSSEESESQDEFDEELQLNFSALKKIDRKSCSIMVDPLKSRKSRVTISGDTAYEYESEQVYQKSSNSTSVSKEQNKEKYLKTFKEIQMEKDVEAPASTITAKPNTRSKSILKNRKDSGLNAKAPVAAEQHYGGRESRFIEKIKDIDGKIISSNRSIDSQNPAREVQFRKSLFASQEKPFLAVTIPVPTKTVENKKGARKSCLKRSSFENIEKQVKKAPVRKSKFQMLSRNSIDGFVIKNRKSLDGIKEIMTDRIERGNNADDSDEGSSYNIFGSSENVAISKQIKEKLGLREQPKGVKGPAKARAGGGKSILKKNSVLIPGNGYQKKEREELLSEQKPSKKSKKSVMFTKSRFAE